MAVHEMAQSVQDFVRGKGVSGLVMLPEARQFYVNLWKNRGDMDAKDIGMLVISSLIETVNIAHGESRVSERWSSEAKMA